MSDNQPPEHPKIDPVFKELLTHLGQQHNFPTKTEVEVNRLPRRIDAIIKLPNPADRDRIAQATSFIRLRAHNQIEFKGVHDRLYLPGYQSIRGRMQFYLSKHRLNLADLRLMIVCAVRPTKLLNNREISFKPLEAGYYLSNDLPPSVIIVVNELPLTPKHYPLLLFASSEQRFREVLRQLIEEEHGGLIRFAYYVRPDTTSEEIMLPKGSYLTEKNLRFILNDIGEELMDIVTPELVKKSPAYKDIIAEWEIQLREKEQALKLEASRVKQAQTRAKLNEEKAILAQRRALFRTLHRFFGDLPSALTHQIEQITDLDQLEQWLELAFEVESLAQFQAEIVSRQ